MILLIVVFSLISPVFFTLTNIMNIITQNTYLVIAAIGVGFVMICGGVDLSVGYQVSIVGVSCAALMKWVGLSIPEAIIISVLFGVLLGFINGLASISLKVHSMIVTLATMTIFQGISYLLTGSKAIFDLSEDFKFIGQGYIFNVIPVSLFIMIVVILVASFILNLTYFGRYIYATGSNNEAARLAGINVKALTVIVFSIASFFVAISSVVLISRAGSSNSSMGPGTEFTCITAAVLGGISFKGGEGKIWGIVVGVFILGILSNGMQLIGLGVYPQYIAKGIILIISIALDTYQKEHSKTKNMAPASQVMLEQ
jgi:Ribose/xylose/arabinose/galactoside ABC-type transport systems, permease components